MRRVQGKQGEREKREKDPRLFPEPIKGSEETLNT